MPGLKNAIAITIVAAIGVLPLPALADGAGQKQAMERAIAEMLFGREMRRAERREVEERRKYRLGPVEPRHRGAYGTVRPYKSQGTKYGIKKRPLPDQCLRWVNTGRGDRLAYSAHCLDRSYRHASKLPGRCETLIRTDRGYRAVYGARCLARDGGRGARR